MIKVIFINFNKGLAYQMTPLNTYFVPFILPGGFKNYISGKKIVELFKSKHEDLYLKEKIRISSLQMKISDTFKNSFFTGMHDICRYNYLRIE